MFGTHGRSCCRLIGRPLRRSHTIFKHACAHQACVYTGPPSVRKSGSTSVRGIRPTFAYSTPVLFSTSAKPSKSCLPTSSRTSSPSRRRSLHQRTAIGTSPPAARLAFHLSTHLEQPAKEGEWRFSTSLPSPSVGTTTPTPPHSSCSIAHFRCGRRFDC